LMVCEAIHITQAVCAVLRIVLLIHVMRLSACFVTSCLLCRLCRSVRCRGSSGPWAPSTQRVSRVCCCSCLRLLCTDQAAVMFANSVTRLSMEACLLHITQTVQEAAAGVTRCMWREDRHHNSLLCLQLHHMFSGNLRLAFVSWPCVVLCAASWQSTSHFTLAAALVLHIPLPVCRVLQHRNYR
jgi:hypothetical protein